MVNVAFSKMFQVQGFTCLPIILTPKKILKILRHRQEQIFIIGSFIKKEFCRVEFEEQRALLASILFVVYSGQFYVIEIRNRTDQVAMF